MKKIALITGATSGIGKATAERLAGNGFDIIITGRRKEKLQELEDVLKKEYNVDVLSFSFYFLLLDLLLFLYSPLFLFLCFLLLLRLYT